MPAIGIGIGISMANGGRGTVPANRFNVLVDPLTRTIEQGESATFAVTTELIAGVAETATLSVIGLPTGATGIYDDNTISTDAGAATLTVSVAADAPPITNGFIVHAVATSQTKNRGAAITIPEPVVLVATSLIFSTQPSGATVDTALSQQPAVTVKDQNGDTLTSFSGDVTITIASGTGTLGGDTVKACVAGVATFTDLEIDSDDDFTLEASIASPALSVESDEFTVESGVETLTPADFAANGVYLHDADQETDPDETAQTTLQDFYGNGITATASAGAAVLNYASKGVAKTWNFDGATTFNFTSQTPSEFTWFGVVRINNPDQNPAIITSSGVIDNFIGTAVGSGDQALWIESQLTQDLYRGFRTGLWMFIVYTKVGSTRHVYRSGAEAVCYLDQAGSNTLSFSNIGGFAPYIPYMDVGVMGLLNRAIAPTEVAGLMNGFQAKYQLGPLAICVGNSLTYGTGTTDRPNECYPTQLRGLMLGDYPNFEIVNFGIESQTTREIIVRFEEQGGSLVDPLRPANFYLMCEGGNDLFVTYAAVAGQTAEQAIANLHTLAGMATAKGFDVIIGDIPHRVGYDTTWYDAVVEINLDINDPANLGSDWVKSVALSMDVRISDGTTVFNSTDGTHFNATGYSYWADDFSVPVIELLP